MRQNFIIGIFILKDWYYAWKAIYRVNLHFEGQIFQEPFPQSNPSNLCTGHGRGPRHCSSPERFFQRVPNPSDKYRRLWGSRRAALPVARSCPVILRPHARWSCLQTAGGAFIDSLFDAAPFLGARLGPGTWTVYCKWKWMWLRDALGKSVRQQWLRDR
jgi:hypothetical protein